MSAIASFYLIDISKLPALTEHATITVKKSLFSKKITDNYGDYLAAHATALPGLEGSAYVYSNLFAFLEEEKNMDLLSNEYEDTTKELIDKRGSAHFLFTHQQKTSFLPRLEPDQFSLADIQSFNEEFSEEGDEETTLLTLEALRVLYDNLGKIAHEGQVLLLIVG